MFRLYLLLHEAIQIKFTFSFVLEVMLQGVVFFSIKAVVGSVKSNNNHYDRIIKLYYVRLVRKKQTNTTENSTQYQAITSFKAMLAILVYISMSDNSIEYATLYAFFY